MRRFARAGRPGAYFGIVAEGALEAGDAIEVLHRPNHDVTVGLVAEAILVDPSRLSEPEAARADFSPKLTAFLAERGL